MKNISRFLVVVSLSFSIASCATKAKIDVLVEDAIEKEVIVKQLNINQYEVLDTLRTDAQGKLTYSVKIKEGEPEFVYLFYGERKIASLLLEAGDNVQVTTDTAGIYTVFGSENCDKLMQVENDFANVAAQFLRMNESLKTASEKEAELIGKELARLYINYYRSRVRYVLENSHSLTVIPVCYQQIAEDLPVFGQATDAITFSSLADSLEATYPNSKYVKAFRKEANARMDYLYLSNRIAATEPVSFIDIELPDINGEKRKLSEVDSKVIMIHFWTSSQPYQSMMNLDVLEKLYKDYHSKGFEIFQVAIDIDKSSWARVVKEQNLPWINVCDSKGSASKYVGQYNLTELPVSFFICNGDLVDAKVEDEKSIRALLDKLLK